MKKEAFIRTLDWIVTNSANFIGISEIEHPTFEIIHVALEVEACAKKEN